LFGVKSIMASIKRAFVGVVSPLEDAGILLHVLNILGPGHHLFISAVSKAWRETYKRVASVQIAGPSYHYDDSVVLHSITTQTTICSAVFASASRVTLAHECGLTFDGDELQRIAGRAADIPVLEAARNLGAQFTEEVLLGAAEVASVPTMQWLHAG
jgi:hypothetical protein